MTKTTAMVPRLVENTELYENEIPKKKAKWVLKKKWIFKPAKPSFLRAVKQSDPTKWERRRHRGDVAWIYGRHEILVVSTQSRFEVRQGDSMFILSWLEAWRFLFIINRILRIKAALAL